MNINNLNSKLSSSTKAHLIIDLAKHDLKEAQDALAILNEDSIGFIKTLMYLYQREIPSIVPNCYSDFKKTINSTINQKIINDTLSINSHHDSFDNKMTLLKATMNEIITSREHKDFHHFFKLVDFLNETSEKALFLSTLIELFFRNTTDQLMSERNLDILIPINKKENKVLISLFHHLDVETQVQLLTQTNLSLELNLEADYFKNLEKNPSTTLLPFKYDQEKIKKGGYALYLLECIVGLEQNNNHLIDVIFNSCSDDKKNYMAENIDIYIQNNFHINWTAYELIKEHIHLNLSKNVALASYGDLRDYMIEQVQEENFNNTELYTFLDELYLTNQSKPLDDFFEDKEIFMNYIDLMFALELFEEQNINKISSFLKLTYFGKKENDDYQLLFNLKKDMEKNKEDIVDSFDVYLYLNRKKNPVYKDNIEETIFDNILSSIEKQLLNMKMNNENRLLNQTKKIKL